MAAPLSAPTEQSSPTENKRDIAVVGGGAAGFFAAIHCAQNNPAGRVTIFEAGRRTLDKVRISGGGRCNVTHACFDPAQLIRFYPRGQRALRGPFTRFGPREVMAWFNDRGVALKTEDDGRIFPTSDDSATIVECLRDSARQAGVRMQLNARITKARVLPEEERNDGPGRFRLETNDSTFDCHSLLLTTGGAPGGLRLARELGHKIVDPVPSLFTFNLKDSRLAPLPGVAVNETRLRVPGTKLEATGPLLVTHAGLSGPAVLRLSAFGARETALKKYRFPLLIDWLPAKDENLLRERFKSLKEKHGGRGIFSESSDLPLPRRLWRSLVSAAGIAEETRWSQLTNASLRRLVQELKSGEYHVTGKSVFKEEFVTCGGVDLKEVDFRTMESRLVPGLFFGGEVLDVDALTGGFNFQNAWTTGFIAGMSL